MLRHDPSNVLIYNTDLATNPQFFNGSFNTMELDFDPLINGFSFFKWTVVPKWVITAFPGFKDMTEKNFLEGFSISDIELETEAITWGFSGNEYNVAKTIKKGNTEFNIKHREFSGSPIRNAYQFWISGMRDPEIGIATYCRVANCDYAAKNHTGEIVYMVTRPDANNVDRNNLEFACYWTAVFPTKIQLNQFAFTHGDHSLSEYEQSFKGCFHMSNKIDTFAKTVLREKVYGFVEMGEFDPTDTTLGKKENIASEFNSGTLVGDLSSSHSTDIDKSQGGNASQFATV